MKKNCVSQRNQYRLNIFFKSLPFILKRICYLSATWNNSIFHVQKVVHFLLIRLIVWICDIFFLPFMIQRASQEREKKSISDVYVFWIEEKATNLMWIQIWTFRISPLYDLESKRTNFIILFFFSFGFGSMWSYIGKPNL